MAINLTEYACGNAPGEQNNPVIPAVRNTVLAAATPITLDPRTTIIRIYNDGAAPVLVGMDLTNTLTASTAESIGPGQQVFHSVLTPNVKIVI